MEQSEGEPYACSWEEAVTLMERGKDGQKGIEQEHCSDTEANGVQFYKERSNPRCQNPLLLGERTPAGSGKWQITSVRGQEPCQCHGENTRVRSEWDVLKESGKGRHQAAEDCRRI